MRQLNLGDFEFLLLATRWTILLSIYAAVGGGIVGLAIALMRTSGSAALRWIAIGYIRVFQGTPLLLQLFLVFFGGDMLGIPLGAWLSAILGFSLNAGAFLGEIWRGAIQAVPSGQIEAAKALGLHFVPRMLRVVLPQALRMAIPPTVGFPGEPDQEHLARRDHRLRGADARRTDAQQRHLPPVRHLRYRFGDLLRALLAVDPDQPPP